MDEEMDSSTSSSTDTSNNSDETLKKGLMHLCIKIIIPYKYAGKQGENMRHSRE